MVLAQGGGTDVVDVDPEGDRVGVGRGGSASSAAATAIDRRRVFTPPLFGRYPLYLKVTLTRLDAL